MRNNTIIKSFGEYFGGLVKAEISLNGRTIWSKRYVKTGAEEFDRTEIEKLSAEAELERVKAEKEVAHGQSR